MPICQREIQVQQICWMVCIYKWDKNNSVIWKGPHNRTIIKPSFSSPAGIPPVAEQTHCTDFTQTKFSKCLHIKKKPFRLFISSVSFIIPSRDTSFMRLLGNSLKAVHSPTPSHPLCLLFASFWLWGTQMSWEFQHIRGRC